MKRTRCLIVSLVLLITSGPCCSGSAPEPSIPTTNNKSPLPPPMKKKRLGPLDKVRKSVVESVAAFGLVSSISWGLVTDRAQLERLRPSIDAMDKYLTETGIKDELEKTFSSKVLKSAASLWRLQKKHRQEHDLRDEVLSSNWLRKLIPSTTNNNSSMRPSMSDAAKYMRYATAAYGDNMIQAARIGRRAIADGSRLLPSTRERISQHIGIPAKDIVIVDIDFKFRGHKEYLRHFIAIDHANKSVVLSIRGTFNIPDLMVDAAAFSRPFCGGEAHSEMALMAEKTWKAASPHVLSELQKHSDYSLVITGHSLGAGTACLVNILCHQRGRQQVKGHNVKCFAYASPPVFSPVEVVPQAVESTTCYLHGDDIVPFLSVASVRRLASTLQWMKTQKSKRKLRFLPRRLLLNNKNNNNNDQQLNMTVAVMGKPDIMPKRGSPQLLIPAADVVWTKECDHHHGTFDYKVCDPKRMALLGLQLSPRIISDHSPVILEEALHYLEEHEAIVASKAKS